jgi:hypothetical protein
MRDQPKGPIARFFTRLKVDADLLRAPSVIRPGGTAALPKRISASKILQAPRPGPSTSKKK